MEALRIFSAEEIIDRCHFYAQKIWGRKLDIDVKMNGRLTRCMGRFVHYPSRAKPCHLEFSKHLLNGCFSDDALDAILKHELAHWVLFTDGRDYRDGSGDFEREIKRIGGATQGDELSSSCFYATCGECGKIVAKKRIHSDIAKFLHNERYTSSCCDAPIEYGGVMKVEQYKSKMPADVSLRNVVYNTDWRTR